MNLLFILAGAAYSLDNIHNHGLFSNDFGYSKQAWFWQWFWMQSCLFILFLRLLCSLPPFFRNSIGFCSPLISSLVLIHRICARGLCTILFLNFLSSWKNIAHFLGHVDYTMCSHSIEIILAVLILLKFATTVAFVRLCRTALAYRIHISSSFGGFSLIDGSIALFLMARTVWVLIL